MKESVDAIEDDNTEDVIEDFYNKLFSDIKVDWSKLPHKMVGVTEDNSN